jgi:hypothetical protein
MQTVEKAESSSSLFSALVIDISCEEKDGFFRMAFFRFFNATYVGVNWFAITFL